MERWLEGFMPPSLVKCCFVFFEGPLSFFWSCQQSEFIPFEIWPALCITHLWTHQTKYFEPRNLSLFLIGYIFDSAGTFVTWFYLIQLLAQQYQAFARRGVRGAFKKYLKWIVKNPHTFNLSSLGIYLDEVVSGRAIGL